MRAVLVRSLALLAVTSCNDPQPFRFRDEEVRSVIWVAEENDRVIELFAAPTGVVIPLRANVETSALLYAETLLELQLEAGPVPILEGGGRELPPGARTVHFDVNLQGQESPGFPERYRAIRIPNLDPLDCATRGGCISRDGVCRMPCPVNVARVVPVPPEVPRPMRRSCPEGWTANELPGLTSCASPPPVICEGSTFQLFGSAVCTELGASCSLPSDRGPIFHVLASAAPGGDGSMTAPFATLLAALEAADLPAPAPAPFVIALGIGDHSLPDVTVRDGLLLIGSCEGSRLVATGTIGELRKLGGQLEIRNVQLQGVTMTLINARTRLEGIVGHAPPEAAAVVVLGGEVEASRMGVIAPENCGFFAHGGGGLILSDVAVRGPNRGGICVGTSATATISRVAIRDSVVAGVFVEDGTLRAEELLVRDSIRGLESNSSTVHVATARFEDLSEFGALMRFSRVEFIDVEMDRVMARSIDLETRSTLIADRLILHEGLGVFAKDGSEIVGRAWQLESLVPLLDAQQASIRLEDVWQVDSGPVTILEGTTSWSRVETLRPRSAFRFGSDDVVLKDLSISEPVAAFEIFNAANVVLERVRITGGRGPSLLLFSQRTDQRRAEMDLREIDIQGAGGEQSLRIGDDLVATMRQVRIAAFRGSGILATGTTHLDIQGLEVDGSLDETTSGISLGGEATLMLSDFQLARCSGQGLVLVRRPSDGPLALSLTRGLFTQNSIAIDAAASDEVVDLAGLLVDVAFIDNGEVLRVP